MDRLRATRLATGFAPQDRQRARATRMDYEQPAGTRGKEFRSPFLPFAPAARQCRYSIAHLTIDLAHVLRGFESDVTNTRSQPQGWFLWLDPNFVTAAWGLSYEMMF